MKYIYQSLIKIVFFLICLIQYNKKNRYFPKTKKFNANLN